jgi:hypothetical protein
MIATARHVKRCWRNDKDVKQKRSLRIQCLLTTEISEAFKASG